MKRDANQLVPIVGPAQHSPEWHAARLKGIGASEASEACGLSTYKTPLDIYLLKRQLIAPQDETEAMAIGTLLEPAIITLYERRTGFKVERPCPMLIHPVNRFIFASLDGRVNAARLVEGKSMTWRLAGKLGEEGTDELPEEWICQAQQQMYVAGASLVDVAVLIDNRTYRVFTVKRNEALIELIVAAETELWQRIKTGDPPEPNWTHPRTAELVKELYGVKEQAICELDDRAERAWMLAKLVRQRMTRLEKIHEVLKAYVAFQAGDSAILKMPSGHMVTRKVTERAEFTVAATSYVSMRDISKADRRALDETGRLPSPDELQPTKRKSSYLPERKALFALGNDRCHWCNKQLTLRKSTYDHVVPLAKGGSNSLNNGVLACAECNHERADSGLPMEFLPRIVPTPEQIPY